MTTVSPQYYEGFRAAVGRSAENGAPLPAEKATSPPPRAESPPEVIRPEPALSEEERIKREGHPLDAFPRLLECAKNNLPPGGDDAFRFRWFGLFYQGPRQDAFVLRLRLPGGRLRAYQLEGLAALAQELAGGCVVCNAQGGLDIPGVPVRDAVEVLRRAEEIGLRTLLSGGDCVRAVRGGEIEGLTEPSRPPVIYGLVRELEQALAADRRLADLPAGCEVVLCRCDEAAPESGADGGAVVFQIISAPSVDPVGASGDFSLSVPGFGTLDVTLSAAQVVPACLELLGRWAGLGDRTERQNAGLAAFCTGVGGSRLREWLARRAGSLAAVAPDARVRAAIACPPTVGVPVPGGCLMSAALERLAEVARRQGTDEVRLAGGQLFIPCADDGPAAEAALRGALDSP